MGWWKDWRAKKGDVTNHPGTCEHHVLAEATRNNLLGKAHTPKGHSDVSTYSQQGHWPKPTRERDHPEVPTPPPPSEIGAAAL